MKESLDLSKQAFVDATRPDELMFALSQIIQNRIKMIVFDYLKNNIEIAYTDWEKQVEKVLNK